MCRRTSMIDSISSSIENVDTHDNNKPIKSEEQSSTSTTAQLNAQQKLAKGTLYACISITLLITGLAVTFPLLQSRRDELQCDSLCYGSMTSVRSALTLVGTAIIGKLSDKNGTILARTLGTLGKGSEASGRRACLHLGTIASLVGLLISVTMHSLQGLWLSMIPSALLSHNFDIYKSLLSEFHNDIEQAEEQVNKGEKEDTKKKQNKDASSRSGSVGKLGMSAGISFMIGPSLAAFTSPTFQSAAYFAIVCALASWAVIFYLPLPSSTPRAKSNDDDSTQKKQKSEFALMNLIKLQTPKAKAAMTLLVIRLNMALAFHIFNTVWPASLKARFAFGPSDHARFMSYIGITYAASQGFMAKRLVSMFGKEGKVYVIMLCCAILGVGRYIAFYTSSLAVIYISFLFIINALGTLNTVITADTGYIAPRDEVGSLFGILQAAESAAGMAGPLLGGMISRYLGNDAPLVAVVGVYGFLFAFVSYGYERYVISADSHNVKETIKKSM